MWHSWLKQKCNVVRPLLLRRATSRQLHMMAKRPKTTIKYVSIIKYHLFSLHLPVSYFNVDEKHYLPLLYAAGGVVTILWTVTCGKQLKGQVTFLKPGRVGWFSNWRRPEAATPSAAIVRFHFMGHCSYVFLIGARRFSDYPHLSASRTPVSIG